MKQNKYDDPNFFNKYSQMPRSTGGLESAGEWHILKNMLPNFENKNVLDLGCGFGWHCRYADQNNAASILGIDISKKMLEKAISQTNDKKIRYECNSMEDVDLPSNKFDVVISSLAFHYVKDFNDICKKIYNSMTYNGDFIFSVEHPIFTANNEQDWYYNENGEIQHWPVDNYQYEGIRTPKFLGEEVIKYHITLETYINTLIQNGFVITKISEPIPPQHMIDNLPGFKDELRRPMFLMISAKKINF